MYKARIEIGPALELGRKDSDVCTRQVIVTIALSVMSSAPRVMDMYDPKPCTDESLNNLMGTIVHTLKFWGVT